jgi:2-haloacid dehalogenase
MVSNRRQFIQSLAAASLAPAISKAAVIPQRKIKAVAFDAFPILDPRPVFALAEELYPGKGPELSALWRTRQFEYMWLSTLMQSYRDFWQVTEESLIFAANSLRLDLVPEKRERLMNAYLAIKCWPDAPAALHALKDAGIRLGFLSNVSQQVLQAGIRNSGLDNIFEYVLSTDQVKAFKPDPRAYQMGLDAFRLEREEIAFAAFAGWDTAGARSFGYPTFWVNRQGQPQEELGFMADAVGTDMNDLTKFVLGG